jgi:hypothetical protein
MSHEEYTVQTVFGRRKCLSLFPGALYTDDRGVTFWPRRDPPKDNATPKIEPLAWRNFDLEKYSNTVVLLLSQDQLNNVRRLFDKHKLVERHSRARLLSNLLWGAGEDLGSEFRKNRTERCWTDHDPDAGEEARGND